MKITEKLLIVIMLIGLRISLTVLDAAWNIKLSYIAVAGSLPLLLFSRRRFALLRRIDWTTLIFFAAMFVLMEAVWQSGFFQRSIDALHMDITTIPAVMGISVALSQLISNVPLVALYLPFLEGAGPSPLLEPRTSARLSLIPRSMLSSFR